MSGPVILRLQNLPLEANSQDIRRFFDGLVIPDGGVHIIGGEKGDAFIAFHNDEDSRQAMKRDGYYLCNTRIKLYMSSKNEMQNVIQAARNTLNQHSVAPLVAKASNSMTNQQSDLLSKFISPLSNSIAKSANSYTTTATLTAATTTPATTTLAPNIFDQLKNIGQIFGNSNTSNTAATKLTANSATPSNYGSSANNTSLPPVLADILTKAQTSNGLLNGSSSTSYAQHATPPVMPIAQNNGQYAQNGFYQAPSQPGLSQTAVQVPQNSSGQLDISQLLSIIQSTLGPPQSSVQPQTAVADQKNSSTTSYTPQANNVPQSQPLQQNYNRASDQNRPAYQYANEQNDYQQQKTGYNKGYKKDGYENNTNHKDFGNQDRPYRPPNGNNDSRGFRNNRDNREPRRVDGFQQRNTNDSQSDSRYNQNYQYDDTEDGEQHELLDPIIRVRNFNVNCSYKDVRTFLQGIQIEHDGIKLLTDMNGNRTGMAYVKLMTITDLKKALCRNGQFYDTRSIEVVQSTQLEFQSIADNTSQQRQFGRRDEKTWSNDRRYNNNDGNYQQHSQQQHHHQQQPHHHQHQQNQHKPFVNSSIGGYYLKIINLPPRVDKYTLKTEFSSVNFLNTQFVYHFYDRNIGQRGTKIICEVETKQDLERALTRNNDEIGKGRIVVAEMTRSEYENELMIAMSAPGKYFSFLSAQS